MEKTLKSVVEYRKKIEQMPYFVHTGQILYSSAFIVCSWKEFHGYRITGGVLGFIDSTYILQAIVASSFISNPYLGALILLIYQAILSPKSYDFGDIDIVQFRQSFQHFLHEARRLCERNSVFESLERHICDQFKFANETVSAMSCYKDIMVHQELRQKGCDQINEIKRLAISNPLFTPNQSNTFFMPVTKGVGIVAAALVFFIVMKHKYRMLKKHKTN